jgi:hypothetical protein
VSARQAKRGTEPNDAAVQTSGSIEFLTAGEENLRYAMQCDDWIYLAEASRPGGTAHEVLRKDTGLARELLTYIADVFDGKKQKRFDGKERKHSAVYKRGEQRTIGAFYAGLMRLGLSQKEAIRVIRDHVVRVDRSTILRAYKAHYRSQQEQFRRCGIDVDIPTLKAAAKEEMQRSTVPVFQRALKAARAIEAERKKRKTSRTK